eukprot:986066-Ditylum_brightwellii.AAC.1
MAVSKTSNNKSNGGNKGPKTDDDDIILNARGRDCHVKPMWCARNPCYSRAKFRKRMEEKKKSQKATGKVEASDNFKVALSAMLTEDEFKMIESQFLN